MRIAVALVAVVGCLWIVSARVWGEDMLYDALAARVDEYCGGRHVLSNESRFPYGNSRGKLLRAFREHGMAIRPDPGDFCTRRHSDDEEIDEYCLSMEVRLYLGVVAFAGVSAHLVSRPIPRVLGSGTMFEGWYVFTPFGWVPMREKRWIR